METKQENSIPWEQKKTVQKGNLAEQIVETHLRTKGLIPYWPRHKGPHPFDALCASLDKKHLVIADVKGKARRTYYADSGFNVTDYEVYCHIRETYRVPVFVYFVDEYRAKIYGNNLKELERPRQILHKGKYIQYPLRDKGIIYFPLVAMKVVSQITEKEAHKLRSLSARSYEYENLTTSMGHDIKSSKMKRLIER